MFGYPTPMGQVANVFGRISQATKQGMREALSRILYLFQLRWEWIVPTIIPSFLLKKLYVKGSFKNTANGFQLSLNNTLAPGTLLGVSPLQIDGRTIPLEQIQISVGDHALVRASDITASLPSAFPLNTIVTFLVQDQTLTPGPHRLTVQFNTKEVGELRIDAEDTIE